MFVLEQHGASLTSERGWRRYSWYQEKWRLAGLQDGAELPLNDGEGRKEEIAVGVIKTVSREHTGWDRVHVHQKLTEYLLESSNLVTRQKFFCSSSSIGPQLTQIVIAASAVAQRLP